MKNGIRSGWLLLCGLTLFVLLTLVPVAHAAPPHISAGRELQPFPETRWLLMGLGYDYWESSGMGSTNSVPHQSRSGPRQTGFPWGPEMDAVGLKSDGSLWAWGDKLVRRGGRQHNY